MGDGEETEAEEEGERGARWGAPGGWWSPAPAAESGGRTGVLRFSDPSLKQPRRIVSLPRRMQRRKGTRVCFPDPSPKLLPSSESRREVKSRFSGKDPTCSGM